MQRQTRPGMPPSPQKLEEASEGLSLEPPEGAWPRDTSVSDFWPP